MTLRQIGIRIVILVVFFLVLVGVFRQAYETGSSALVALVCIALFPLGIAAWLLRIWRWFDM